MHATISSSSVVRPTQVIVDLNILRDNFIAIKTASPGVHVMPILKANAYGHGLVRVAQTMEQAGADLLGVAVLEEGLLLRERGVSMPILVLGGILGNQIPDFIENNLILTASSIDKLQQIEATAGKMNKKARVHLKFDTGMERIGVHYYNAPSFILTADKCRHIEVEGIYSHFANADAPDLSHAQLQQRRFQQILSLYKALRIPLPRYRHMANSAAILRMPDAHFNLIRPGILLYGVYPVAGEKRIQVQSALTWKSSVVYFKVVKPGHPVGYGSTWESPHPVRAVTVPVGYGDGYFHAMSGKAEVLINGRSYPVVGRISMDQIVVNIEQDSAFNEDEVILLGRQNKREITASDLARWAGTIPYEVLTNINTRVPRVYV